MLPDILSILIVDDFDADRQLCCRYLNAQLNTQLQIIEAESGEEGLAQVERTAPDVILLDHILPDITSIEFIQYIRAKQQDSQTIIIVLSGQGNEETAVKAIQSGAQDYLAKDMLTPEKLAQTITQAMTRLHLEHQLHRNQMLRQIVADCSRKIYKARNLDEMFNTAVHDIHRFLECDRVIIYQFQPDKSGLIIAESSCAQWAAATTRRQSLETYCQILDNYFRQYEETAHQLNSLYIFDNIRAAEISDCYRHTLDQLQVRNKIVIPIVLTATANIAETNFWGLLIVHQCSRPRHWDDLEIDLLNDIAVQMAIAIQQVELIQQLEQELADHRQAEQNLIQAHSVLKQMNKELEMRVAERTSKLTTLNTQLQQEITQRQHIHDCLQKRTAEFESIFQAIPDAVIFTNTQHQIQSVNPAFIKLFGSSSEGMLEEVAQQLYQHTQECHQSPSLNTNKISNSYETTYCRFDETLFIGETVSAEVRDSSDHLIGYLSIIRDVSERKQAEVAQQQAEIALRYSEQRFRAIFNHTFELVGLLEPNGLLLNINQTAIDFAGITREQVINQPFWETVWWQYSPSAQRQLQYSIEQAQEGQFIRYEVEIQAANGCKEIIDFSLKPVFNSEGRITWLLAEGRLITQRIVLERELRAQKKLLSSFFDATSAAHIGAGIFDTDRRCIRINSTMADMNGVQVQTLLGNRLGDIDSELLSASESILDYVFNTQESIQNIEITGETVYQPGGARYWLTSYFPIPDESHMLHAVGMIAVEITRQKQIEKELTQLNQALTRSNQELEQFAYVASHDLREPLRKIGSYSELFAKRYRSQVDERADRYISHIVSGVSRMNTLIGDLLSYSQLGRGEAARTTVNLEDLIKQVMDDLASIIQENQAHVVITSQLPTLMLNQSQIQRLFQNLIENAVKYRSDDSPLIQISATSIATGWQFSVADNGIGIDPEFSERIFAIFQRLHTREAYPGTGIGLAICKRVVEHHGGLIWLEPVTTKGTTICFTLPESE